MSELVLNKDTMKVVDRAKADIGRMYPAEFLSCVTDDVRELLHTRLEEKGMKRELELLDTLVMMERYSSKAEVERLDDMEAMTITESRPLTGDVDVTLSFHLGNKRRVDLDNLSKGTLDAMRGIVFVDDCQIVKLTIFKHIDKSYSGVMISVSLVNP